MTWCSPAVRLEKTHHTPPSTSRPSARQQYRAISVQNNFITRQNVSGAKSTMFKCEEKGGKNSPNYISSSLRRTLNKTTKVPAHKNNLFCFLNMWTIHRPRDYWSIILNHRIIYRRFCLNSWYWPGL